MQLWWALLVVLCAHDAWAHEGTLTSESVEIKTYQDESFNKILGIKKMADDSLTEGGHGEGRTAAGWDESNLGANDAMLEIEVQATDDSRDESLLLRADRLLRDVVSKKREKRAVLGEAVAQKQEYPKIQVRDPVQISRTVKNVVKYLRNVIKDGKTLSQDQIHQARKWYLETTAIVLGRYAYEDQKAEQEPHKGAAPGFDALKSRAEAAKQGMDKIDAAEHLHKMGAESWMDHNGDQSGTNILSLMTKTGRLARFLSEIEDTERSRKSSMGEAHQPSTLAKLQARESEITGAINKLLNRVELGDPITRAAPKTVLHAAARASPKEKKLMGKLMSAADKEDKARIIEAAGDIAGNQMTGVMKDAADGIKQKEKEIKQEQEASEEDDSHVIYNAQPMVMTRDDLAIPMGTLHHHVTETVNRHLDQILKLFRRRKTKHKHLSVDDYKRINKQLRHLAAHLMQKYTDKDEEVPFALKVPLAKALTMPLASVAWMRKQSHIDADKKNDRKYVKEHGHLPVHTALTVPLDKARKMLAPLKKDTPEEEPPKGADNDFGNPFARLKLKQPIHKALKLPLHRVRYDARMSEEDQSKTAPSPEPEEAKKPTKTKVAASGTPKEASGTPKEASTVTPEDNTKETPDAATPTRDPITQFVWSTLGKGGVHRMNKAETLADLLRNGVHLRTGTLRFVAPQ